MSLVIQVADADLSAQANPALFATVGVNGVNTKIPKANLQGLYLFETGTPGDAYGDTVLDLSGNGRDALRVLSSAPTKRSYGAEVTDVDGLVLETGIRFPRSFTAIGVMRNGLADATQQFPSWFHHSAEVFPVSNKAFNYNKAAPYPAIWNSSTTSSLHRRHVIHQWSPNTQLPSSPIKIDNPNSTSWNVVAFCADGPGGTLELVNLAGQTTGLISDPDLVDYWDQFYTASNTVRLGWVPHSAVRPCNAGELGAFAVYDVLLSTDVRQQAMKALAARVAARGVTIFGA